MPGLFQQAAPALPSPILRMAPGEVYKPAYGWYWLKATHSIKLQRYDPVAQVWRYAGNSSELNMQLQFFDGQADRLANTSGCVVAAVVTTAGSALTTVPAVTASEGGATFLAIVGGAISTAATIVAAGSNYTYPPLLYIQQPPQPGVQATGYTTITNGTIATVTIDGQGAGYLAPPVVNVVPDSRDTTGAGGNVSLAITGAATVTAIVVTNHGSPIVSGTVPTLTFVPSGPAATAVMDWGVQSASITAAGAGYGATAAVNVTGAGGYVTTAPVYLGDQASTGLQRYRQAIIDVTTNASGGLSAVGAIIDPGAYQGLATPQISGGLPTTVAAMTFVMGGTAGTAFLMPAQS